MGFFFATAKKEAKAKPVKKPRLADIPIASLQALGCEVCPRNNDTSLRSPKMRPSGPKSAPIYLLGTAPSEDEDADDNHWTDKAGTVIYENFGRTFMKEKVRSNFIQQCRGDQTQIEIECCRSRIVADIEVCRPEIIVTIGDAPLVWATGLSGSSGSALVNRGELFVAQIGNHRCWVFSILYPNFVHKKRQFGKSEYELTLEHDIRRVKELVGTLPPPIVYQKPYDEGVEIITGDEPGDFDRLQKALHELACESKSAVDVETNGLRPWILSDPRILTAAVGTYRRVVAFAVDHPESWGSQDKRDRVKALLRDYLLFSGRKAAHNLSMELEWFAYEFGTEIMRRTEWDDTMAMAHTLDERPGTKSLDYQTRKHFGFFLKAQSPIDVRRERWWLHYALKDILHYNGMDTKWTDLLRDTLAPTIYGDEKFEREYERKVRLAPTLIATEAKGLKVDFKRAMELEKNFSDTMKHTETQLRRQPEIQRYEQRLGTFQVTNPDHVLKLYKEIEPRDEIKVEERDGKIRWTTEEEALAKINLRSSKLILEHRAAAKLHSTYILPVLEKKIVCPDGRMRCKYGSMVAVTGRLNSEDPNLQNFPKRKHREVREIVRAANDWLAACDYGQIEFRVIGMASEDRNLVKYCWTGYDVHGYWAGRIAKKYGPVKDYIREAFSDTIASLLKKDPDEDKAIMKTLRQESKNGWVFPQFFGSSSRSCAENLHIPEDIAEELAREFWDEFPGVKEWQDKLMRYYEKHLYVETLGGRKRRGPMTKNHIINLPIQGTALDIVTAGMNALSELSDLEGDPALQPSLNVHDDLTFDLLDSELETHIPIIAREMCRHRFDYINVPLIVEVAIGERWNPMEEIKVFRSNELFNLENPYA